MENRRDYWEVSVEIQNPGLSYAKSRQLGFHCVTGV